MPDWPKKFLYKADKVVIESEGHTWSTDGATFVRCLESGGWTNTRSETCLYKSPGGLTCTYPLDHEIHDQQRARHAGWRYHGFKDRE
jgi:hypothetical protein